MKFRAVSKLSTFFLYTLYINMYIVQPADMHVSAFYASSVQLGTHRICGCIVFIHVYLLSPSARFTTQHNQHMWTCAERHRARVLKRPQGMLALHYSDLNTYCALLECSTTPKWRGIIVQSADMHVSAFYASYTYICWENSSQSLGRYKCGNWYMHYK